MRGKKSNSTLRERVAQARASYGWRVRAAATEEDGGASAAMLLLIRQPAIKSERAGLGKQDIERPSRSNFNRETGRGGKKNKITGIPAGTRDLVHGRRRFLAPRSSEGGGEGAGEGREWLTVDAAQAKPPATSGIGEEKTCLGFGFGLVGGMIRDGVSCGRGWNRRRDGAGEFYNVRPRSQQLPPCLVHGRSLDLGTGDQRVGSIAKHWREICAGFLV